MEAILKDVLEYALGDAPEGFLKHLIAKRTEWDEVFTAKLDEFAYELWPELARWELSVDDQGKLHERRLPLIQG